MTKPLPSPFLALTRRAALPLVAALALAGCGTLGGGNKPAGEDIHVMTSGGFTAAYNDLRPEFERSSGRTVKTAYGASMGNATDSIPSRLARNEPADVVILARPALDALVAQGKVVAGSQVDLVRSSIGFAVRKGAPSRTSARSTRSSARCSRRRRLPTRRARAAPTTRPSCSRNSASRTRSSPRASAS